MSIQRRCGVIHSHIATTVRYACMIDAIAFLRFCVALRCNKYCGRKVQLDLQAVKAQPDAPCTYCLCNGGFAAEVRLGVPNLVHRSAKVTICTFSYSSIVRHAGYTVALELEAVRLLRCRSRNVSSQCKSKIHFDSTSCRILIVLTGSRVWTRRNRLLRLWRRLLPYRRRSLATSLVSTRCAAVCFA